MTNWETFRGQYLRVLHPFSEQEGEGVPTQKAQIRTCTDGHLVQGSQGPCAVRRDASFSSTYPWHTECAQFILNHLSATSLLVRPRNQEETWHTWQAQGAWAQSASHCALELYTDALSSFFPLVYGRGRSSAKKEQKEQLSLQPITLQKRPSGQGQSASSPEAALGLARGK